MDGALPREFRVAHHQFQGLPSLVVVVQDLGFLGAKYRLLLAPLATVKDVVAQLSVNVRNRVVAAEQ
jgi:hypothetical protein